LNGKKIKDKRKEKEKEIEELEEEILYIGKTLTTR